MTTCGTHLSVCKIKVLLLSQNIVSGSPFSFEMRRVWLRRIFDIWHGWRDKMGTILSKLFYFSHTFTPIIGHQLFYIGILCYYFFVIMGQYRSGSQWKKMIMDVCWVESVLRHFSGNKVSLVFQLIPLEVEWITVILKECVFHYYDIWTSLRHWVIIYFCPQFLGNP
jgi:hypothetical protein